MQRATDKLVRILIFLINNEQSFLCGTDIRKSLSIASGTVYPILHRLRDREWLESVKEDIDPKTARRPPKIFYRITAKGKSEGLRLIGRTGEKK